MSSKTPLLHQYCTSIEIVRNETSLFHTYWLYIGNITNDRPINVLMIMYDIVFFIKTKLSLSILPWYEGSVFTQIKNSNNEF